MVCFNCHKDKPDVCLRPDPYLQDVEDDSTEYPLCDDCCDMLANEI